MDVDDAGDGNSLAIHTIEEERDDADASDAVLVADHQHHHDAAASEATMQRLLTPGGTATPWMQCTSATGECYYYDSTTGETTWDAPSGLALPSSTDATAATSSSRQSALEVSDDEHNNPKARHSLALVKRVMDGSLRRLDPHTQLQLEEARRRHRELEALRDEEVSMGAEHWIEMFDPTHDTFYYYGLHSGEMRWDRPDSYVMSFDRDDVLRMVVRLQCAFRMRLARRRVFQRKIELGLVANDSSDTAAVRPWVEVYDPFHKVLYYYCASSGETRWDPPEVFISAAEDREMAAAIAIQSLARSHLARRELKQRRATLRRRQQEKAMEELRRLREIRRREYFAKSDDERESICRRELLDEEMEQIGHGDLFWGRDRFEQEVLRQMAEEKMLADAEAFWQRVNATLRQRSEMERYRSMEEDVARQEAELMEEANERDAMAMAERDQCFLGDAFWGIQAEEKREERTRLDLDVEDELSRVFGAHARVEELQQEWAAEAERLELLAQTSKVQNEKKFQRQYFKWFYHQCLTAEQVLDYVWPTMQRFVPPVPSTPRATPPPSLPDILFLDGSSRGEDTLLNDVLDELLSPRSAVAGTTPVETQRSETSHQSGDAFAIPSSSANPSTVSTPIAPASADSALSVVTATPTTTGGDEANATGLLPPEDVLSSSPEQQQQLDTEGNDDAASVAASSESHDKYVAPERPRPPTITYVLDDIVLRHRLDNEFTFSGRSILTVHDAQQARILARRGRFDISRIPTEPAFLAAAKRADKQPRPTSPRRPMPDSSKAPKPRDEDSPTVEPESSPHHHRSSLPYQRVKVSLPVRIVDSLISREFTLWLCHADAGSTPASTV
ncbi:hypothetical protein PINS_up013931 [Pythium insidiosum]|nr:hypothetical protein PINS_up013931 [Pythium insidiosum]